MWGVIPPRLPLYHFISIDFASGAGIPQDELILRLDLLLLVLYQEHDHKQGVALM